MAGVKWQFATIRKSLTWGFVIAKPPFREFGTSRLDGSFVCWAPMTGIELDSDSYSGTYTQVSINSGMRCAVPVEGPVECWDRHSLVPDAPSGTFTKIAAGGAHVCGIRADGTVDCSGSNMFEPTIEPGPDQLP